LKTALNLCRVTGTTPSFLLHPLDLVGGDQIPELSFFPGMDVSGAQKSELFETVLKELKRRFTLVNMSTHAKQLLGKNGLRTISVESKTDGRR